MREALLALHARRCEDELAAYRFDVLTWTIARVMGGTKEPAPKLPAVLRG